MDLKIVSEEPAPAESNLSIVSEEPAGGSKQPFLERAAIAAEPYVTPLLRTTGAIGKGYPVLEAGANLLTGVVGGFPAYLLAGANAAMQRFRGIEGEDPQAVGSRWAQTATYQPQTEEGQYLTKTVMPPLTALQEASVAGGHGVADVTGSQTAGAITEGAIQMAPAILAGFIPKGTAPKGAEKPVAEQLREVRPIEKQIVEPLKVVKEEPAPIEPPVVKSWDEKPKGPLTHAEREQLQVEQAQRDIAALGPEKPLEVVSESPVTEELPATDLRRMANESGWAETGGRIIRSGEGASKDEIAIGRGAEVGEVIGRTKWVPNAEWYQRMRQDLGPSGLSSQKQIADAVEKHLAGEPLGARAQRTIDWMKAEAEADRAEWDRAAAEAKAFSETEGVTPTEQTTIHDLQGVGLPETGQELVITDLMGKADEINPDAAKRAAIQFESDDHGLVQALQEIISGKQKSETTVLGAGDQPPKGFALQGETPAEAARAASEKARIAEEARRKAGAPPAEDFTLSGSSRVTDEAAARGQQDMVDLGIGASPKKTIEAVKASPLGQKAAEFARGITEDFQMKLTPMAAGSASERARAVAKGWANQDRLARSEWGKFDDILKKNFTPEQRAAMGRALDEQSVLEQTSQPTTGRGLDTLPADQRTVIEIISEHGKQIWERAKAIGMVEGEGLPSYMPRMIVNIGEDGKVSRVQSKGTGTVSGLPEGIGQNVITSTPNLLRRKYLTAAETEAAAKAKFGEGATLVQDIRALPAALARLERAIAGRELIAKIKEIGKQTGRELVSETEKPGTFTVDHPAFKTYRPRFVQGEDGKITPMLDQQGNPVFDKVPLYVADEFKGPLKAILSEKSGAIYNFLMELKGKAMSMIMYSPLIHNEVEFGRSFALMPIEMSKIGLAKGFTPVPNIYLTGNRIKNNPAMMRKAIAHGLVPIGKRFGFQDITGMMEEPTIKPGRSWTAQIAGGTAGLFNRAAGEAVKRGIDTTGDFWHNTLLWDRVGDLQMGLYGKFLERALAVGLSEDEAGILAAHFSNRYAGVLPNEATSAGARKVANFIFFSRSFTGGNIGAMKDAFIGLPRDIVAQLKAAGADEKAIASSSELARTFARRKAIGAIIKDVALAHLGVALVSSAMDYYHDRDFQKILEGYRDRWQRLQERAAADPWDASNPFEDLRALSPSSENEAGKEDRVRVGTQEDGTAIYMRLPFGKIGEEMERYLIKPLDMMRRKVGTIMRPLLEVYYNDKGFGRPVYNPDAKTIPDMVQSVVDSVLHIAANQFPVDSAEAAKNIVHDIQQGKEPKAIDEAKVVGPLAGMTFSKGAPGGPAVGEMFDIERKHRNEVYRIQAPVRKLIQDGDIQAAIEKMHEAHMTQPEIASTIRYTLNPGARLGGRKLGKFYQIAPEAERERMQRLREEGAQAVMGGK